MASPRLRHADLEPAKWLALAAMTVDHAGKIALPQLGPETHLVGRVALPLLAWIVAVRLALEPALAARYLRRLAPWALVSQPVWVLAGRAPLEGNILFTLALGVMACAGLHAARARRGWHAAGWLLPAALLAPFVEYGLPGVLLAPALLVVGGADPLRGPLALGPLGVLANLVPEPPHLEPADAAALVSTPAAWLSTAWPLRLPRLPTHLFYAYYPAHLLALHLLDLGGWL
jgi:hypothetical protein